MGGHAPALPGLKLPNSKNKLWRTGLEKDAPSPATSEGPQQKPEAHSGPAGSEGSWSGLNRSDTFTSGNITIPRPHGRKTPELGSVLVVPAGQPCSRGAAREEEGGNLLSGRDFPRTLEVTPKGGHVQRSTTSSRESVDLINLDPLTDPGPANSDSVSTVGNVGAVSSTYRGTLPLRSYPPGSSPLPPRPHLALNPFAQQLQHLHNTNTCSSPQMHYMPPRQENPFGSVHGPRPGSYFHTPPHSFPAVPGLYGLQHSFGSSTLPSTHGRLHSAFSHDGTRGSPLPTSASNSALSGLAGSPAASERDAQTQDPFADLLTMVKQDATPKETVADVRLKWETFE